MINDFKKELECSYKGETYSVRDNGAVLRHPHNKQKPRPKDNVWTFGKYNEKTGYAEIAGERIHRIVATAFHGAAPSSQYVVDHIDTNRRNNRPENLRWITKLENILLNPITAKKIVLLCGSIEEFLREPSKLRQNEISKDFEWMRAVSKEEAATSLERLLCWAKSDKVLSGGSLGEWIYNRSSSKRNLENERIQIDISNEKLNNALGEIITKQVTQELKLANSKTNPFNFPRPNSIESDNAIKMYRTRGELFGLLKALLESEKKIKLPCIILQTAGKGMVVKDAWIEEVLDIECCYEGKSHVPKSIILHCKDSSFALLLRIKSRVDETEISKLTSEGINILEIDLSWAKVGVTEEEMKYVLQTDLSKKKWLHHMQILETKRKLQMVCEPICCVGHGVAHSYFACPLYSNSVEDLECWYCNYRIDNEICVDREMCNYSCCFGKSGIQTYEELLSITNVEKEAEWIVGITYNINGKTITKKFDKEVQLPGSTLFQLWNEKNGDKIIAHNIYSGWYVLIETDPKISFDKTGKVFAKLSRSVEAFKSSESHSIFSFDSCCWEIVK